MIWMIGSESSRRRLFRIKLEDNDSEYENLHFFVMSDDATEKAY